MSLHHTIKSRLLNIQATGEFPLKNFPNIFQGDYEEAMIANDQEFA